MISVFCFVSNYFSVYREIFLQCSSNFLKTSTAQEKNPELVAAYGEQVIWFEYYTYYLPFWFSDKKPLVRRDSPEEVKAKVRRGSQKRQANPMKALAEFQAAADEVI